MSNSQVVTSATFQPIMGQGMKLRLAIKKVGFACVHDSNAPTEHTSVSSPAVYALGHLHVCA